MIFNVIEAFWEQMEKIEDKNPQLRTDSDWQDEKKKTIDALRRSEQKEVFGVLIDGWMRRH